MSGFQIFLLFALGASLGVIVFMVDEIVRLRRYSKRMEQLTLEGSEGWAKSIHWFSEVFDLDPEEIKKIAVDETIKLHLHFQNYSGA